MKKCPICELNYMQDNDEACSVCKKPQSSSGAAKKLIVGEYYTFQEAAAILGHGKFPRGMCFVKEKIY